MSEKSIFLFGLLVYTLAIVGSYFFPTPVSSLMVGSPVGTTFNTAKVAAVVFAPTTGSATSTFLYNSDVSDRYITDSFSFCTGLGTSRTAYTGAALAALLFQMSTTSATSTANISNTNYAANLTIATSSPVGYTASSTEGVLSGYSRIWPTATYLGIWANATNTASCVTGVHYLAS